jgi:hypothetical protein
VAREEGIKVLRIALPPRQKAKTFSQHFVDFKHPWKLRSHLQKSLYLGA